MSTRAAKASKAAAIRKRSVARKPASFKKKLKTLVALLALLLFVPVAIGSIYFLMIFVQESRKLPSIAEIGAIRPSEGTQLLYSDNTVMAVFTTENRKPIKLEEMGTNIVEATIATEDSRFYEHKGVDLHGVARAIFKNVTGGEVREGASTITQQLARNVSELGIGRERRLRRKVAEAILAMRIEQTFNKDEILEQYLNLIYYGNGAYGIEAAARSYFHKPAKKLSLSEAALLAGIPQRPARYSDNKDAAYRRRDWVLQRMLDTRKISEQQYEDARNQELKIFKPQASGARIYGAHYFVNYVMQKLVNEYGADAVYSGWKIRTTLDRKMQQAAEEALRKGIRKDESANVGALVSLDPHTGYIRAMVGGLDFRKNQFNAVTQGIRQPGSAFKPIVYATAINEGKATLDSTYRDDPDLPGINDPRWQVRNYSGKYSYNRMRVLTAIANSINTVAVKVALDAGLDNVIEYAHRMGISTPIDKFATLALGASGVRPIELCSAYTTFANPDGRRAVPVGIIQVADASGAVILQNSPQLETTGLTPETVKQMNEALRAVVEEGTAAAVQPVPNSHGKTGTTSESRDAWFAGYTPELVTVIWAAHENRGKTGKLSRKNPYLPMPGKTGGHLCAPIWCEYMLRAVPLQQAFNKAMEREQHAELAQSEEKPKPAPEVKKPAATPNAQDKAASTPATGEITPPTSLDEPVPGATSTGAAAAPIGGASAPIAGGAPSPELGNPAAATLPEPVSARSSPSIISQPPPTPARSESRTRVSEPPARLAAPRIDPEDEYVSVRVCAESGRRANQWCPVTTESRMRKRDRPGLCRRHHDPDN